MKTALLIFALLTLGMYLQRAKLLYRRLFTSAEKTYGERTARRSRKGFAVRAALWFMPAKLYHWKQILWAKKVEKLLEEEEREGD